MSHGDEEQLHPGEDNGGKGFHKFGCSRECCVRCFCWELSRDKKTRRKLCLIRVIVLGTILSLITLVVPVIDTYFITSSPLPFVLSPGDTRIVSESRSSAVCQGATLSGGKLAAVNSSMYFLSNTPTLSANNSFVISSQGIVGANGGYKYISYYLHTGAEYSLTACVNTSTSIQYYLIKGSKVWKKSQSSTSAYGNVFSLSPCSTANTTTNLTFSSEDDYYFIFHNEYLSPAPVLYTFSFYQPEYSPQSGDIISNCTTLSFSSCFLAIPYNSDYKILLVTSPPTDGDWSANVDLTVSCAARAWVYVLIEIGAIIIVAILVLSLLACYFSNQVKVMFSGRIDTSAQNRSSSDQRDAIN